MDSIHKASQAQETRVALVTGGTVQPGSGAGYMRKGDVCTARYLIECKTTTKQSYRLDLDTVAKIEREAIMDGKDFALFIEISGRNLVVLDENVFLTITEPPDGP